MAALGGAALEWHADGLWTRTRTDRTALLGATSGQTTRLRFGLEASWEQQLERGGTLTPQLSLGLRHDGGDAETGFGLEIGGGLDFVDPARGLSLRLEGRTLALHEEGSFENWGLGLQFAYDPRPETKEGFSMAFSQSLGGASSGGVAALLGPETFPGLSETQAESSWALEAAYGESRGRGMVGSPYGRLSGSGGAAQQMRLGYRIEPDKAHAADVNLDLWADPALKDSPAQAGASLNWNW